MRWFILGSIFAALILQSRFAWASADSNGPNGINSSGLSLTGMGVNIGQVETRRPGDPTFDTLATMFNSTVDPEQVFYFNGANFNAGMNNFFESGDHAVEVAGLMISTDAVARGVAPDADLFSFGMNPFGPALEDAYAQGSQAANHIATLPGQRVWAINMSINAEEGTVDADGSSTFTSFVDWSAATHDILYVTAGFESGQLGPVPSDNFNGMTVVMSKKNGGIYREVDTFNVFTGDDFGVRTFSDIVAPGRDIQLATRNNVITTVPDPVRVGTSLAAPHVTGTAALLHQHAVAKGFGANGRRHEVMKAVLMNSADKIKDDGAFAPAGSLLGMQRTVLKSDGTSTWFDSTAYLDGVNDNGGFIPLDDEMGAGHLNAERAFVQYDPGETNPNGGANVPAIGWDYHATGGVGFAGINRYQFNTELSGDSFISITLAWDREVPFSPGDGPTYESGDTFVDFKTTDGAGAPPADSQINNLTLWLLPAGSMTTADAIATSDANEGTLQHIFFQLPNAGEYEFWVEQRDNEVSPTQDYGIAWWAKSATLANPPGDFNNDGMVDGADLAQWRGDFGDNPDSDADGDGDSDGADFLAWQRNLGTGVAVPATGAVPEPAAWLWPLSACRF